MARHRRGRTGSSRCRGWGGQRQEDPAGTGVSVHACVHEPVSEQHATAVARRVCARRTPVARPQRRRGDGTQGGKNHGEQTYEAAKEGARRPKRPDLGCVRVTFACAAVRWCVRRGDALTGR
jgi:hypothetical protein